MFAPKALKSDKGQNIDRGGSAPDCSSSEFSEDDTPLAVRLNSQGRSQPNDAGKRRPRAPLSKKGGFVIPRKKKQANELLQVSNFNAREGKDLLRHVTQSYRDTAVGATFKFEKLELVYNDQLSREFHDKKQHMRTEERRNARELEDKFAFLYTVDRDEAKKICEVGLEVGSSSISCLGDPSMGVYLCRHADVISKKPLLPGVPGYLIVFKVIKGKVKPVTERSGAVADLLEPSPNFNCHVSRSIQSLPANSPLSLVFEYSQYYFYEYAEEGDDLHVKRPRQCLPYALLTFTMVDSSAPPQEPSVLQQSTLEELPTTDNNGFLSPVSSTSILRHETRIPEKRRGRSSHVIWMGVVANKDRILAEAQLVCHSVKKIKPPFEIGEKIVMKEKISFEQLRPLLTFPLFHSGPPSVTNACQASLAGGTSFLHCDLLPVEDDRGKIQKLVKFFQQKKWAGIVKCPDANRVIFLIPTSQITFDLGITTVDSPAALHVLLYAKNQKSNKGKGISKTVTSGSVREKDLRDVNQIQKELKRQFSHQVEGKEKPTEHRRLSQDSARPAVASASSCKDPRDVPEFAVQSNEQAVQWKNAVENWLSRPHPLGGTEADLQKAVASSGIVSKMAHLLSSVTHVPKPRVPMAETPLNIPFEAVHARSSGSTEQYGVISGWQDASAKSSVSAEEYKVIPGRQDGGARLSHCVSTEKQKVISGQPDGHTRLAGNAEQQRLFIGEQSDITSKQVKQHARSSGSTEQYRVISGQQDASAKSSVSAEEYKEIPGRQDGGEQFIHCFSTEKDKVISGQHDGHARLAGNAAEQRLFVGEQSDITPKQVKQHARSSGSTEQYRVTSGQQDASAKSSVSAEEYKEIPGRQDGGEQFGHCFSTEKDKVISGQHDGHARLAGNVEQQRLFVGEQSDITSKQVKQHARSTGSTEQYRVISGQQDASAKSSVDAEEYKEIPGRHDGGARFSHCVSTEKQKMISGQQDGHARLAGNAEWQRLFVGEHSDVISKQEKQDNVIKKDAKPSVPPVIVRKEEHREDPRLMIRRSLDEQVNSGLKSPNIPQISHGTPYNAEEALQAQGVKLASPSVTPVITSTTPSTPQLKYQVDGKSIRELLDKINVQSKEESTYKVALDDGTRRALELMKLQGAKNSKPEVPGAKKIVMDANTDSKLDTEVCTRDDKSVKRSSTSVTAAEENVKRIKIDNVSPAHENLSAIKGVMPTPSSKEEPAKHGGKAKGVRQPPRQRSVKKPQNISHVKEPKEQNDSSIGEEPTKPVVETAVPELSEAPFPKILSPECLKSPPTSVLMSKAPKVKLILRKKDSNDVGSQSHGNTRSSSEDVGSQSRGNTGRSSEDALSKQPSVTEEEEKGDLERGRKVIDSPVSMDISPQCSTPSLPESVSPITVVSSKGRYQMPVPPTGTPTTSVHSAQSYATPVSSSFPFTPPLPEGPYRSTILPQPRPPTPGQQPVHLMPFVPPLPAASSGNTTPSLAGALPSLKGPTVSSASSGGSLPCNPLFQDASFVPHSAAASSFSPATSVAPTIMAFAGSPSYPPPPSAASVQRKNSTDAFSGPASSAGNFSTAFPGQQWTGALPHSQGFVFPVPPLPGVVAIPPTEALRWPTVPGLPRPVLPPVPARPLHVFPQQLACPPQTTPFQGSLGEIPVQQPQGGGFVPIGVPRFHLRPVPPAITAQITPVRPIFGAPPAPPAPPQFQPHLPFQHPRPIGYWVAPLKPPAVHSGKTTGHVGCMPSHSPAQKHSKELQQTSPSLSQKNKDSSVEKEQNGKEQNKEHSNDASSEGPKSNVSVQNGEENEKSNAPLEKHREVDMSKVEMVDVDTSKEKVVTTTSIDKKATAGTDKEFASKAVEESVVGSAKQLSRDTDGVKVQDSETLIPNQMLLQELLKLSSKCEFASDLSANKENQIAGQPRESSRDDSTDQRSKSLQGSHVADSVSSEVCIDIEEASQMAAGESKTSSSPVTPELSGNFGEEHLDVSVSSKIAGVVEIDCLPTITYQTEAERKGFKAKSKIYDILRQNAQQMISETDSADQEEVENVDDPDNPDSCAVDEDLIADDEGIAEEEKLLLSGEESTAGEQAVQLDCGLRVVQLLELDRIHDQDKERACEEDTTLVSNAEHEDGQPQEELPSQLQQEMLPMDSEFEDISDVSDEGTPERDLPGYGSVDIEQLWSSKAVDIVVPVSEAAPTDTVHSTVPVLETTPVDTVDRTVPVSETAPVDTAHSTVPETVPKLLPKEVSKPKAEVVHNEADSSSSLTKKHGVRKRHITFKSQKRKRWDSTSEDTDANKYSSSSKRSKKCSHRRSSCRKSPDRRETGSSSRKRERARWTSESSCVKSEPHSRRIVSEFKGGSLQITILRDCKSGEMEVKEEETISPEKQENEEKHPLVDVEYSDLEDISPGRLSSDDESPGTPPTPETAIPAVDFTHPSLGFWAAPLKTNEPTVSGSAVVEEHQVSGKEIFAPPTHSSRLEERPVNLEPSQVRYPLGEMKFYEDEPFIGQSSWPAEGFFCQTTTSEERDLASQGVEKNPFLLDDSVGHYLSHSSQESEEEFTRYPQSEVFEYGHGVRDHLQPQEQLYRSGSHAQSRGMQKEIKHRSANRETRYPWQTREESKHSQVPSAGGEGIASASQSAIGKNIGCDEESSKHATTKKHKDIKGAHSTNDNESVGDDARDWKIYVFACMKKPQFENWIRRKNFAAKLAGKCSVVLTPEQVRRSSERWYRRVKKQLRRTNHSSRPQTEDLVTSDCVEFDFDDMDVESNSVNAPSGSKEQSCCSVSKELQQCGSVNVNNKVERCTVHSTHMEHHISPGTERSAVVHRHVNFNSVDECNFNTDDLMCDKEVSIILKQDDMDDVSTSNVGNDDANSSVLGIVTSKLAGTNIPEKAEQCNDGLLEDQVTLCEEDDTRPSLTSEAAVGCIKQQGDAKECTVAQVLDESACHHAGGEGNGRKVLGRENEVVLGPGFEEVIDGQGRPSQEQDVAADVNSVRETEVIRTADLSVNAPHNQGIEGTATEVKEASLMHTKDIVAEDAKVDVSGSFQVGVLTDTAEVADDHGSCQDPAKVARQGIQEVENALVHIDGHDGEDTKYSVEDKSVKEGNDIGSLMDTDYIEDKPSFTATAEPQTNIDGNFDKAAVALERDKRGSIELGETNTTATYRSPIVSSLVTSSAQLDVSQSGSSTAVVSAPYQPNVLNLPALQRPSLSAVPTPIIPVTSCFPAFQNFQQNLAWQVARHACPFTTSAIAPVHAPTRPPGDYGLDPSLVDHPLHAPIPVGCVRSHSTYDDDICPPGTENISLEPSNDSADVAPVQETEGEETSTSMVDKQLHESVMDNSMVTALMQFYSEIEEVESSGRNGVDGAYDTTETNSAHRVSTTAEESTQTKTSKSHETTKDMEVEYGREHSYKGVPEGEEMSEPGYVSDSVHKTTESLDREGKLEGENRELQSTGTSTKESQTTGGMVWSEVAVTRVENRVDRTEVQNPVIINLETTENETLVKNPKVETERAQVTDSGITEDAPQMEYSSITVNESLADNPGNSMNITLSATLATDETVAENGPMVENANAIIDKTKVKKADDLIETILTKEPDDAVNKAMVGNLGIAVDETRKEDPCTAVDGTQADERPSKSVLTKKTDVSLNETLVDRLDIAVVETQKKDPCTSVDGTHADERSSKSVLTKKTDVSPNETLVDRLDIAVDETQTKEPCIVLGGTHAEDPDQAIMGGLEEEHRGTHAEEPADAIMEGLEEEHHGTHAEGPEDAIMVDLEEAHSLSPIDPLFMASAEQTIFSSIGDLRNLLGQSSTFDRIAEEAIASTVSSLEDVLRQAHRSYLYLESSSCPSDSGVSVGEEGSAPSKSFSNVPLSTVSLQDGGASKIGSVHGWSASSCLSAGMPSQMVTATDARAKDRTGTTSFINKEKLPTQKKIKKTAGHRKFYFYVYSLEHDRECEAVKNYMLKAGGSFVDVKDPACLEENSRELKVFIRRKHLPAVHRLANLYQLKMLPCVRFSLFNTLADVIEGSRFYENIFVSGGALITDDSILKTIELGHLDALLRYLKEQSLAHQKFVWVLNISRNGYKKLSLSRPQTKRDSKVLNLIRQYREDGFITVLQKGYVAEGMPAAQRYLQTSLKLQIDLISVYRHVILLSDMDKNRMELPWFLERGIGVMNVKEFLTTFAGEREASSLLSRRVIPEVTVKESSTVPYCSTPEDETVSQTPEGTPVSDSSNDSPYTDTHAPELLHSSGAPQKRAGRSSSLDAGTMTHTRLHILSCVRSVRDNIRSQISSSSPSSPVSRSM